MSLKMAQSGHANRIDECLFSGVKRTSTQMSMVDTWAATGAGAFSLSENGLYTLEGWRKFLDSLAPNGVFTVSRW
jgi:hypothetical protein